MAKKNHTMAERGYCMAFLIVITHILLSHEFVEARKIASVIKPELVKHKGTVTTIKREDGDIIDCVDIYKQPAFDHPLLKNHTIEMEPSSYPRGINPLNLQPKMTQSWQKNEQCPEGTVPIRRAHKLDYHRAIPFTRHSPQLHPSNSDPVSFPHEYAQVTQFGSNYYGAHARINVWNPKTEISQELSIAQIWLFSNMVGNTNTIEAGWMVLPLDNNDTKTRFFIYWTSDDYQNTGCYNLDCPGFVLTNRLYTIGGAISPVSGYDDTIQHEIAITIYKSTGSENWWLMVQDQVLGYWPDSIFTSLANSASAVSWGGEVMNTKSMGRHTSTQMGSGHFPNEGFGKSSFFRNLGIIDQSGGTMKDPEKLQRYVTYPTCYDLHIGENKKTWLGTYFYFGGPGYSDRCP